MKKLTINDGKRIVAIWGAGLYGSRFSVNLGRENFDFFIDKNPKSDIYLGHPIVHPDKISDEKWERLFVYVPFNYFNEIKEFLEQKGLIESRDFESYDSRLVFDEEMAEQDYNRFRLEADINGNWSEKTVIWGRFWIKKEYIDFFTKMKDLGADLAVLSEAVWINSYEAEQMLGIPALTAPCFADEESVVLSSSLSETECLIDEKLLCQEKEHLKVIHENHYSDRSYEYTVKRLYDYIKYTIEKLEIKKIISTGSTMVSHIILTEICRQKNIQIVYTHQGCLPGTIAFDSTGEVGESVPAIQPDGFCKVSVTRDEQERAGEILKHLVRSGLNRKVQPNNAWIEQVNCQLIENHPIVLYAGQDDIFSHMVPYTEKTKKHYSPMFKSSEEALFFLAEICRKNEWNLIYKPHPMCANRIDSSIFPENVIYVPFGNINEMIDYCDVMITILSSVNYISLIRKTPVVMLGYNQIKGKGCAYEAYEKDCIEDKIRDALRLGFTEEQQEAFTKHVAQSLKYYLYDDLQHKELEYGKKVPNSIDDFYELERVVNASGLL